MDALPVNTPGLASASLPHAQRRWWRKVAASRPPVVAVRVAASAAALVGVWALARLSGRVGVGGLPTPFAHLGAADAVRACVAASLDYTVGHLDDFQAETGASALKAALLDVKASLLDASVAGGSGGGGGGAVRPLVIDVGANRGQNVPVWRSIYGRDVRLVLIEGNPPMAKELAAKWQSATDTVSVVQRLVSNQTGLWNFRVPKGDTSWERAAIQAPESVGMFSSEFDYVELPADTLDDIATNVKLVPSGWVDLSRKYPIDFLKTDMEGWDVTGLQGAAGILRRTRFVLWECHLLMALANGPRTTHAQGAALLAEAGFETYKISRQFVRFDGTFAMPELDERANMGWHNCFAIRPDDPVRRDLLRRFNILPQCVKPLGLDR